MNCNFPQPIEKWKRSKECQNAKAPSGNISFASEHKDGDERGYAETEPHKAPGDGAERQRSKGFACVCGRDRDKGRRREKGREKKLMFDKCELCLCAQSIPALENHGSTKIAREHLRNFSKLRSHSHCRRNDPLALSIAVNIHLCVPNSQIVRF